MKKKGIRKRKFSLPNNLSSDFSYSSFSPRKLEIVLPYIPGALSAGRDDNIETDNSITTKTKV